MVRTTADPRASWPTFNARCVKSMRRSPSRSQDTRSGPRGLSGDANVRHATARGVLDRCQHPHARRSLRRAVFVGGLAGDARSPYAAPSVPGTRHSKAGLHRCLPPDCRRCRGRRHRGHLLSRALATFLFGVESTDPTTLSASEYCSLSVALLACWVPTQRAAQIDPLEALRSE